MPLPPNNAEPGSVDLANADLVNADWAGAERAGQATMLRQQMVSALCRSGSISSEPVRRAFLAIAREQFVPEIAERDGLAAVYQADMALVTATDDHGVPTSSSSAPAIMAPMVEALALGPGLRVLEVGAGTGYNAAILKHLVGPEGRVTSVDLDPMCARGARRALSRAGLRCRVVVGDGRRGWQLGAPFDRIEVTASSDRVPRAWRDQLTEGGLLELPLRMVPGSGAQAIVTLRRHGDQLRSTSVVAGGFMPLRSPGGEATIGPPTAALRAVAGTTTPALLASLEGEHVATLGPDAARQALATMLGPGRRVRAVPSGRVADLVMFLTWSEVPNLVLCRIDDRYGVAVVGGGGSSIASVTRRLGDPGWIETRGQGEAHGVLAPYVERWVHLGCPTMSDLRITVRFDHPAEPVTAAPSELAATVGRGIAVEWASGSDRAPDGPASTPGPMV